MAQHSQPRHSSAPAFTQFDVTAAAPETFAAPLHEAEEQTSLLREILTAQDRTNELLEELVNATASQHQQRNKELNQWKQAHPELSEKCREAVEGLGRVQAEFLDRLTEEIADSADYMMEGEFMLSEFVDRFGPRLAHLNGVIQVLAQLSSTPAPADAEQR